MYIRFTTVKKATVSIGQAALLANIENPPEGGRALEAAGFFRPDASEYGFPVFVAPFKLQASTFLLDFGKHPLKSGKLTGSDLDYLYWLYQSPPGRERGKMAPDNCVGGVEGVFFDTHYGAVQDGITTLDVVTAPASEDKNLYLCVRQEGSQLDMAKRAVVAMWNATQGLVDGDGARWACRKTRTASSCPTRRPSPTRTTPS